MNKIFKIGLFGDTDFFEWKYRSSFFNDNDWLMFTFFDPLDLKQTNLDVDAVYIKFSYIMDYYSIFEDK